MITFEEALAAVKEQYPQWKPMVGFEFHNKYVFLLTGPAFEVSKETGEVAPLDLHYASMYADDYKEARDNGTVFNN